MKSQFKKNGFNFIERNCGRFLRRTFLLGLFITVALTSCGSLTSDTSSSETNEQKSGGKASITVSCNIESRTFRPTDVTEDAITKVELWASGDGLTSAGNGTSGSENGSTGGTNGSSGAINGSSGTNSVLLGEWISSDTKNALTLMKEADSILMDAGTYTFTLNLYVSHDSDYSLCQSGILTKTIKRGRNNLSFSTEYLTDGCGTLRAQISWPEDANFERMDACLYKVDENLVTVGSALYTTEVYRNNSSTDEKTALYNVENIGSGDYKLVLRLYDSAGNKINTYSYGVTIATECVTNSIINLSGVNCDYAVSLVIHRYAQWANGDMSSFGKPAQTFTLPTDDDISMEGYLLTGWNTKQDGTGDAYKPGDTFTIPGTSTLYARWAKSYKVKFVNGTEEKTVKVVAGTTVTEPDVPERSGYSFLGWSSGNTRFPLSKQIFEDVTLTSYFIKANENNSSEHIIENIDDWNNFVTIISSGVDTFKDKTVKMTANIGSAETPVKTMVGITTTNCFCGTFDGDGHTLTVDYDSSEQYCAPFKYTGAGVNIKNLKVEGNIKSSKQYTAGLIGYAYNNAIINNCTVSAEMTSTYIGAAYNGGFISYTTSSTYSLENCVFNGKMLGASATYNGGFVGYSGYSQGTTKLTNCLFSPTEVTMSTGSTSSTFAGNTISTASSDYFYTTSLSNVQGARAYKTLQEAEGIVKTKKLADGNNYYVECNITLQEQYIWTRNEISPSYSLSLFSETLTKDTDYTVTIKNSSGSIINSIVDSGDYIITFMGKGNYQGTVSKSICVIKDLDGSGTQASPYLINNIADWKKFSNNVNSGTTYSNKYVKLTSDIGTSDIPVTTTIGASSNASFKGLFDGDNHTITVDYNSSDAYCAPFKYTGDGVSIKNLKVSGKIKSSGSYAAGLIGYAYMNVSIDNCIVSAEITSTYNGSAYNGGFIGEAYNYTETSNYKYSFNGCVFNGKLLGSNARYNGGFVGDFHYHGTAKLTNCLFAPSEVTMGTDGCDTFADRISSDSFDFFYTSSFGRTEGGKVYIDLDLSNELGKKYTFADGNVYFLQCDVTLVEQYDWTGKNVFPIYALSCFSEKLKKNTDYTVTIKNSGGEIISSVVETGVYIISFIGKGYYQGTVSKSFSVVKDFEGSGSLSSPYLINCIDDWNKFARHVSLGNSYEGKYLKLTSDIGTSDEPVITMVGTSTTNCFSGTFDGDNHTITVDYNSSDACCAPFKYTGDGVSIKNLKVSGKIKSSERYAAGLIGYAYRNVSIDNCVVSAEITSTYNGFAYNGGFIGETNNYTYSFNGCVFNGKLLGSNASYNGGFVGYTYSGIDGKAKFINCLFAPSEVTMGTKGSNTFTRPIAINSTDSVDYCYTMSFGDVQGAKVYESLQESIGIVKTEPIQFADGKLYLAECFVSIEDQYDWTGNEIKPNYSLTLFSSILIEDTDYTVAIKNSDGSIANSIVDSGDYTIVFTGKGIYQGSISKIVSITLEGNGTQDSPYLINTIADWNKFSTNVSKGITYSGKIVKLTSNIGTESVPVTKMIGTSTTNCFSGTFDGDNHTITVDYNSSERYCAPFRYTGVGVSIKNLKISGKINSSYQSVAGLIGYATTDTSINNCVISTEITSTYSGAAYNSGFICAINKTSNTCIFENCIFNGKLLGSTATYNGGFMGNNVAAIKLKNCLFAPSEVSMATTSSYTFSGSQITSDSSDYYYTTTLGTAQGIKVVDNLREDNSFYKKEKINLFGNDYYICENEVIPTSTENFKCIELSTDKDFGLQFYGQKLINGIDYTVQLLDVDGNSLEEAYKTGVYTCIFTGKGEYTGTVVKTYEIIRNLLGRGTKENPYLINDVIDWDIFAKLVNDETLTFSGKYVKLAADIGSKDNPVTTQIGTSTKNCFCGNFNGGGHILTINYDSSTSYCAPFRYVGDGADIANLNCTGNVTSSSSNASGLIGYINNGYVTVSDCTISVEINSSYNSGGFIVLVGKNGYAIFNNCAFTGKFSKSNSGFIGSNNGTTKLSNCLIAPKSEVKLNYSFTNGKISEDSINYFYTNDSTNNQGVKLYSDITGKDGIFAKITAADGNEYFAECRVPALEGNCFCYSETKGAKACIEDSSVEVSKTTIFTTVSNDFDVTIDGALPITNAQKYSVKIIPKLNSSFYGSTEKELYLFSVFRDSMDNFSFVEGGSVNGFCGAKSQGDTVTINSLYVSPHEVTQEEYETYCTYRDNDRRPTAEFGLGEDYPAYFVSWFDAIIYCNLRSMAENLTPCYSYNNKTDPREFGFVSNVDGKYYSRAIEDVGLDSYIKCDFDASGYRLPTRAEWEYAARGGSNTYGSRLFEFTIAGAISNDTSEHCKLGWINKNSSGMSHPVEKLSSNALGLYDMCGNVFEWCWDRSSSGQGSSSVKSFREILGGSWKYSAGEGFPISGYNNYWSARNIFDDVGFRVVRTATE